MWQTSTRCHVNVNILPPFTPEATLQTNFKRYLNVCWVLPLFVFSCMTESVHTHTHTISGAIMATHHVRTHTFAKLSVAAICEFIKAFGQLLGVCAV